MAALLIVGTLSAAASWTAALRLHRKRLVGTPPAPAPPDSAGSSSVVATQQSPREGGGAGGEQLFVVPHARCVVGEPAGVQSAVTYHFNLALSQNNMAAGGREPQLSTTADDYTTATNGVTNGVKPTSIWKLAKRAAMKSALIVALWEAMKASIRISRRSKKRSTNIDLIQLMAHLQHRMLMPPGRR